MRLVTTLLLVLFVAVAFASVHCHPSTACSVDDDCRGSHEAEQAGRCAPDVYCTAAGTCRAECLGTCSQTLGGSNLCPKGGVCNKPAVGRPGAADAFVCTKRILPCAQASDCPVYRPGAGEWSCTSGACVFPGFVYRE